MVVAPAQQPLSPQRLSPNYVTTINVFVTTPHTIFNAFCWEKGARDGSALGNLLSLVKKVKSPFLHNKRLLDIDPLPDSILVSQDFIRDLTVVIFCVLRESF